MSFVSFVSTMLPRIAAHCPDGSNRTKGCNRWCTVVRRLLLSIDRPVLQGKLMEIRRKEGQVRTQLSSLSSLSLLFPRWSSLPPLSLLSSLSSFSFSFSTLLILVLLIHILVLDLLVILVLLVLHVLFGRLIVFSFSIFASYLLHATRSFDSREPLWPAHDQDIKSHAWKFPVISHSHFSYGRPGLQLTQDWDLPAVIRTNTSSQVSRPPTHHPCARRFGPTPPRK